MTPHTSPVANTCPPRRFRIGWLLRWGVCSLLVMGVFVGARLTTAAERDAAQAQVPSRDNGDELGSGDWDYNTVLDDLEQLVDDALGPSAGEPNEHEQRRDGWQSTTGYTPTGSHWEITHPADWDATSPDGEGVILSAPDQPNVVAVVSRPYAGSLAAEVDGDLDRLAGVLADLEVGTPKATELNGWPAMRVDLHYTNPTGGQATAYATWVRVGDTLYILTGEIWASRTDLEPIVDDILVSFVAIEDG